MKRREFIELIGAAALGFPRPGFAETKDLPVVGLLMQPKSDSVFAKDRTAALRKGLQEGGFIEGTNYSLAARFAEGDMNRYPQLVTELGALKPRVIVTVGYVNRNFSQLVPEVPIVFTGIAADPVEVGIAQSYNHPGGMITGNVMNAIGGEEVMAQKRIGLFKELVPDLKRLGMIAPTDTLEGMKEKAAQHKMIHGWLAMKEKAALEKVAAQLDFEFVLYDLKTIDDLESAIAAGLRDDVSGFYISMEPMMIANLTRVITSIAASRKPSVGTTAEWGRAGLMMSYATDMLYNVRHAGIYAAKILNGANPGDLPIEQASKFTFVINLKTAKALGIAVPPTLLALADEVIE